MLAIQSLAQCHVTWKFELNFKVWKKYDLLWFFSSSLNPDIKESSTDQKKKEKKKERIRNLQVENDK